MTKRKRYTPQFKAKVVLELLEGDATVGEIASRYDLNPTMLSTWRRQLVDNASSVFAQERERKAQRETIEKHDEEVDNLNRIIGSLTVERDYLQRGFREVSGRRDASRPDRA